MWRRRHTPVACPPRPGVGTRLAISAARLVRPHRSLKTEGLMRRWLPVAALVCAAAACDNPREVAAPTRPTYSTQQSSLFDPALSAALATAGPTTSLEVIVNYDEKATTRDAVTGALLDLGAGVGHFMNFVLLAVFDTPVTGNGMAAVTGVYSIYLIRTPT